MLRNDGTYAAFVHRSILWLATFAAAWVAVASHAATAATPDRCADEVGVFTGITENDLYAPHDKDRHYTNGLRLGWMSPDDCMPDWTRSLAGKMPWFDAHAGQRYGWTIGHNLYTPQDKTTSAPIFTDRPYAAWFYGGLVLQSERSGQKEFDRLDTIELDLGVIGPWALGEEVQNRWHSFFGWRSAMGWANQLRNEPGLDLFTDRLWRIPLGPRTDGLGADVVPHLTASLGNIFTYAGAGGTLRFGQGLQADFGPPRIRPAVPGSDSFHTPASGFAWYFFAGAEARAVARNIFLDGNSLASSQSIAKRPLVGDLQGGFALLVHGMRLTFTEVVRSKEFYGQHHPDYFGSAALSVRF